jgi:hypothetical protein
LIAAIYVGCFTIGNAFVAGLERTISRVDAAYEIITISLSPVGNTVYNESFFLQEKRDCYLNCLLKDIKLFIFCSVLAFTWH